MIIYVYMYTFPITLLSSNPFTPKGIGRLTDRQGQRQRKVYAYVYMCVSKAIFFQKLISTECSRFTFNYENIGEHIYKSSLTAALLTTT